MAQQSAADFVVSKWMELVRAVRLPSRDVRASRADLLRLLGPVAELSAECSIGWTRHGPEVRLTVSIDGPDGGRELTRSLAGEPGVEIDRYLAVEDLFSSIRPAMARRSGSPTT
jgi:hypothetical protein